MGMAPLPLQARDGDFRCRKAPTFERQLQNYPSDRFSGDFAEIWYLMQIHILFRVRGFASNAKDWQNRPQAIDGSFATAS
jgi:hypothetical protein